MLGNFMESSRGQFVRSIPPKAFQTEVVAQSIDISSLVDQYIQVVNIQRPGQLDNQPRVEVNESLGILAFAYEKLRNSVEYREDQVLLRGAIKRILKRRLNPLWQYESIASALIRELIWARYLKNDSIPETKIEEIESILRKYNVLRLSVMKLKDAEDWQDWILGIAACDIEQVLVDRKSSNALAEVMYQTFSHHVSLTGIAEHEQDIQIYLAIHRALLKSDAILMTYHLFLLNAVGWKEATEAEAAQYVPELAKLRSLVASQLQHPKAQDLARIVKRHTPPYIILADVVNDGPDLARSWLAQPDQLRARVESACQTRYGAMRQRVVRAIIRSAIYILITKMLVALLLEIPYDNYFYGAIHWGQLAFNVGFPPLFMAALGLSIKTPSQRNTDMIFSKMLGIIAGELPPEQYSVAKKSAIFSPIMTTIYWLSSLGMVALVSWVLWQYGFTPMAIGLFIFFFGVVVFFAYRVRQIATELSVVKEKQNILEGLINLITLPFLRLGFKLSAEFGKLNVFAFILDVLLEAPFKLILDLTEHWLNFVRQKQEEMVERQEY